MPPKKRRPTQRAPVRCRGLRFQKNDPPGRGSILKKYLRAICGFILVSGLLLHRYCTAASPSPGDSSAYFFYKPYDYGTQAAFNPGTVVLNGGYDIWQIATEFGYRKLFEFDYLNSGRYLWDDVKDPVKTVRAFGTKRFFLTEILPSSLDVNNQQYFPNYALHVVGGGMLFRKTAEWFAYHDYPLPRLWSIATMATYQYINEMLEFGTQPHLTVDPVADLWVFDPLGILVFWNDGVCRFFSEKLHMAEWTLQPAFNARTGNMENAGQFFVYKYPIVKDGRWSLFARSGLHEMGGLSRTFSGSRTVSLAAGAGVENIVPSNQSGPGLSQMALWVWSAAAFYDVNNSLVASVVLTGMPQDRVRINLYPGLLRLGPLNPGLFFAWTKEAVFGFTIRYCPLGLAASSGR